MSGEIGGPPLVVRARCGIDGVVVTWPEHAGRPAALSDAVERFCRGTTDVGPEPVGAGPELPQRHPHRQEVAGDRPAEATPASSPDVLLVELTVTEGPADVGGLMIVEAFVLTADAPPGAPSVLGPARPWSEFRRALLDEAIGRRPPETS